MGRRVNFIVPYFPPDVAADGQLFALLATELARRGYDVRVGTWMPRYQGVRAKAKMYEELHDRRLRVSRMWAPRAGKSLVARAFAAYWVTYGAFWRGLLSRGPILMPSSPPILGLAGWALSLFGRRFVYVLHDVHPELGIALGRLKPGPVAGFLRFVQRRILSRAHTVTLTQGMADTAKALQPKARVTVIPNWVDTDAIRPKPKADSAFAREHGLLEPFVLQYSGNLGLLHPLENFTRALRELPGAVLCYIGRGAKLPAVKELADGADNIRFFDYQPFESLPDSLAACDVAVVAIEPGADRLAMPSKLQGILASGRPVLAIAPPDSELAAAVRELEVGVVVDAAATPEDIMAAVKALMQTPEKLAEWAANARRAAETRYSVKAATDAYATEGVLALDAGAP
jgi:glycosyltransferase involved in cell wall biosynthesis